MDIKPVKAVVPIKCKFDFDSNEIFDIRTGKTVAEISIECVLSKIFKGDEIIGEFKK